MLLRSHRHTATDLRVWDTLHDADTQHGKRLWESGKWEASVASIENFAAEAPCYVSVSWGKDSVVLSHLHEMSRLRLPVVNIAQHGPQYDGDCPLVRDAYLSMFPQTDYREFVVSSDNSAQADTSKAQGLIDGIRVAAKSIGTARYIGGIRADESATRKMGLRYRGLVTANTCQPIGWWSVADVFGWLAYHDLPIHPAYAMLGGGRWSREHIRVSIIGGAKGTQYGRREWEKEYYGDVLRRIESGRTRPDSNTKE